MSRTHCVYCNKEITTRSREHVIQNALGGLFESEDICCPECNNYISRQIDMPFTTIFNPILGSIDNLVKTHNKNSTPSCMATISYNGKLYTDAYVKSGRVVGCASLSRELRSNISKLPLEIVSYNFDLKNKSFQTGMAKIAFNYALACGIDFDILRSGLNVVRSGTEVTSIEYKYPLVPFYPMNALDTCLELGSPTELYHNMILFSAHNQLWCYIDLFNTFQYYVLLSDKLSPTARVYNNYMQLLQKLDRSEPVIEIFSPKDATIYAQQYGVEPCMDTDEMSRRIRNAIASKTQRQSMSTVIGKKMELMFSYNMSYLFQNPQNMMGIANSIGLYFNEDETLRQETFRTLTYMSKTDKLMSYPDAIMSDMSVSQAALSKYTTAKFNKLNTFLCCKNK